MRNGRPALLLATLGVAVLATTACDAPPPIEEPLELSEVIVPVSVLERGRDVYTLYCRACHGDEGDGQGPAAAGFRPPPRNFQQAKFKFGWVVDGQPRDEDLLRIITGGLHGTPMLEWDMKPGDLEAVVQYIKTFNRDAWRDEYAIGTPVEPPPDPWTSREEAVARGELVYHGLATCWSCHPAYVSRDEISRATTELKGSPTTTFRPNLFYGEVKESDYLVGDYQVRVLPPDFTFQPIRSIREGSELEDLYRVLGAGINGSGMPAWEGSLPSEDIWAMAHYVDHLRLLNGTLEAREMRRRLMLGDGPPQPVLGAGL